MMNIIRVLPLMAMLVLTACGSKPPQEILQDQKYLALAEMIENLGPGVDPEEARRAARVAIDYSLELKRQYRVTDPPLIHNMKVNMGLRPRGLCYQWADDLEARLRQENFRTLTLHRAIANSDRPLLIEHSTVIISRKGDPFEKGIVLDPWRYGGTLYWAPTLKDGNYKWIPRKKVFEARRRRPQWADNAFAD